MEAALKHISFFSGVGGFDIGAKRVGIETVACVEINTFCHAFLRHISPNAIILEDINETEAIKHALSGQNAQIFTAGFPCQDVSRSNTKGQGTDGERSGLYRKFLEICMHFRPEYIIMENVANLHFRGLHNVLADIARMGYDAEWCMLSAEGFGFPHLRERVFIVAYPNGSRSQVFLQRRCKNAQIHTIWTPSESYKSFATSWNEGYFYNGVLCRDDGHARIKRIIHTMGNAVMPCMTEFLFRLILNNY